MRADVNQAEHACVCVCAHDSVTAKERNSRCTHEVHARAALLTVSQCNQPSDGQSVHTECIPQMVNQHTHREEQ